jgi:phosphoribosylaminoimidazole-succinocarboxamide synthase
MLGILSPGEYDTLKDLTKRITTIIRDDLAEKGLELYDLKFEFGRVDGKVALIDEISAGIMRAYKDGVWVQALELDQYFA